jgi:sugar O-acyltransferase (sialic acid O-acetyltransferase NeuD family)
MKEKIILIGGGGHAQSIIDTINTVGLYKIVGIIDKYKEINTVTSGVKIIGDDDKLELYYNKGIKNVVLAIGGIGNIKVRQAVYETCKKIGYHFPNIIDSSAILSNDIKIGEGNFIGKGTIINAKVQIGNSCIINTGSLVEHDCRLENFVNIAPGSVLCGNVWIGKNTNIGAQSTIIQNVTIGDNTMIGAGSLVLKDIGSYVLAYGSPAKVEKKYE